MAAGWSVMDALNKNSKAAAEEKPKARFRTRDISIRKIYSNDRNFYSMPGIEQLAQEILAVGLMENMKAYKLQEEGMDTVDANICLGHLADERDYGVGAQILREIGVHKMRLMTNNPVKRVGLEAYGLEITENVAIETTPNPYNERYLRTKKERMGHTLHFNK